MNKAVKKKSNQLSAQKRRELDFGVQKTVKQYKKTLKLLAKT